MSISSATSASQPKLPTSRLEREDLEAFSIETSFMIKNVGEFQKFIESNSNSREFSLIRMPENLYDYLTDPLKGRRFGEDNYNSEIMKFLVSLNKNHQVLFTTPQKHRNPAKAIMIGKNEKAKTHVIECLRIRCLSNKQVLEALPLPLKFARLVSEYADLSNDPASFPFTQTSYILEVFNDSGLVRMAQFLKASKVDVSFFRLRGRESTLSLSEIAKVVKPALEGLKILHENSLIHGAITPGSILNEGTGKLGWGKFKRIPRDGYLTSKGVKQGHRAFHYSAPELQVKGLLYNQKIDIWALGISILELAMGKKTEDVDVSRITFENSLNPTIMKNHELNGRSLLFDFLFKTMVQHPRFRASAEQLLQHPFITQLDSPKKTHRRNLFGEAKTVAKSR